MPINPPRDREAYNAYHRVYQLQRYHDRMARFRQMLGGKCTKCGSTDDLEIDHIDPKTKNRLVSRAWYWNDPDVLAELKKCQLLCETCHIDKHRSKHGTIRRYQKYKCRCEPCRAAARESNKKYRATKRASSSGKTATS